MSTCNTSSTTRRTALTCATMMSIVAVNGFSPSGYQSLPNSRSSTLTNINTAFLNSNHHRIRRSFSTINSELFMSTAMPDGPNNNDWEKKRQLGRETQEKDDEPEMTTNFPPLDTNSASPRRISRIEQEEQVKSKFLHGDELIELRMYMDNLKLDLQLAREEKDMNRLKDLSQALHESQNLDAEFVYANCMEMAKGASSEEEAKEWKREADEARECLPQFNLQGLWVGKYGDHGYEMVNVTYVEDTLIATKVTGDKNVPKGEITFTANLHPEANGREELDPIELSDIASKQWGHRHLPRFPGEGQVAAEGFVNQQWMDGQLILVGEYFSFAWIPLGHQIFFGRPSAELTLKMLKQSKMADFGAVDKGSPNLYAEMRAHAQKCFEETEILMDDEENVDGELCFMMDDEDYFCQDGVFE